MSKEDFNFLDCFAIGILVTATLMLIGANIWFLCVNPLMQIMVSVSCSVAVIIWAYRRVDYIFRMDGDSNSKRINMKKKYKSFWKMVEQNKKEVATWPKWMQRITINADTASTGQFITREKK